jgi:SAM-dependent methyltransferase
MPPDSTTFLQPRDTKDFYLEGNPMGWVDRSLIEEIKRRCGPTLLDLGCGVGGYTRTLQDEGYDVRALDVNAPYVEKARQLGIRVDHFDGMTIPLADDSVDTVFMIEVLEHIPEPDRVLAEVFRVARKNVIITVPNNTQRLNHFVSWSHMLDVDHKNFFTAATLHDLLSKRFPRVGVDEIVPVDRLLARDVLSKWPYRAYRLMQSLGFERDKLFFRLIAEASK